MLFKDNLDHFEDESGSLVLRNELSVEFSHDTNLVFLLLLLTRIPHVCVIFNDILAHFIHSVHQQL